MLKVLSGFVWGAVIAALGFVLAAMLAPLPERLRGTPGPAEPPAQASAVEVPAPAAAPDPAPEAGTTPVAPEPAAPAAEGGESPAPVQTPPSDPAPEADEASAPQAAPEGARAVGRPVDTVARTRSAVETTRLPRVESIAGETGAEAAPPRLGAPSLAELAPRSIEAGALPGAAPALGLPEAAPEARSGEPPAVARVDARARPSGAPPLPRLSAAQDAGPDEGEVISRLPGGLPSAEGLVLAPPANPSDEADRVTRTVPRDALAGARPGGTPTSPEAPARPRSEQAPPEAVAIAEPAPAMSAPAANAREVHGETRPPGATVRTDRLPRIATGGTPAAPELPEGLETAVPASPREGGGTSNGGLPQIGRSAAALPGSGSLRTDGRIVPAPADMSGATETQPTGPRAALLRHRAEFSAAESRPLLGIILVDAGDDGLAPAALGALPVPVSIAVDPEAPGASAAAARWREAGFEVLMLMPAGDAGLTPEAGPGDVETALSEWFSRVPGAIAVLDSTENVLGRNQGLADAVIVRLAAEGHGLALEFQGLNTTANKAARAGLGTARIFRRLDADRERDVVQLRYLERAAFQAARDGAVVMLGHTYPETVAALTSFALGRSSSNVAVAPVSAVMLRE